MDIFFLIAYTIILIVTLVSVIAQSQNDIKQPNEDDLKKVMDMPDEFEKIYNRLCSEKFETLEEAKNKIKDTERNIKLLPLFVAIICIGIITILAIVNSSYTFLGYFAVTFIIVLGFILNNLESNKSKDYKHQYISEYKQTVVKEFVSLFNYKLEYISNIKNSRRANSEIGRAFSSNNLECDYVYGIIDDFTIEIVDDRPTKIGDNIFFYIGEKSYCTITLQRKIDNEIFIICDKNFKIGVNRCIDMGYQYVAIDNKDFNNKFDILAKDNISAKTFFTDDIIETLLDFYNKSWLRFSLSIKNNQIRLVFHTGSLFEPTNYDGIIDKDDLFLQYYKLDFIVRISKLLNEISKQ